jgi:hypothetical protein
MYTGLNTRIIDMTAGELVDLLQSQAQTAQTAQTLNPLICERESYVYGIAGIANLLGVSRTMVHKYRKNGWIEPAISQNGRKIVCNSTIALKLFGKNRKNAL